MFFFSLWAYYARILNKISDFFFFNYSLIILVDFYVIIFLLTGSGPKSPEVDPAPAK